MPPHKGSSAHPSPHPTPTTQLKNLSEKTEVIKLNRKRSRKELLAICSARRAPKAEQLWFLPRDSLPPRLGWGGGCRCPQGKEALGTTRS